jgi:hypothetical protein
MDASWVAKETSGPGFSSVPRWWTIDLAITRAGSSQRQNRIAPSHEAQLLAPLLAEGHDPQFEIVLERRASHAHDKGRVDRRGVCNPRYQHAIRMPRLSFPADPASCPVWLIAE